jgi:hypothetical protein
MTDPLSKEQTTHQTVCAWQEDEEGNLDTDCGKCFCMIEGTPPENGMKFCCYCGKLLAFCSYAEPIEDDEDD